MRRQELNVFRMRLLGAEVRGVSAGSATLKDAINEAMRDWVTNVRTTFYILGSRARCASLSHHGPRLPPRHQPRIQRQILEHEGRLPDAIVACVGGGSNAIGAFYEFIPDPNVELIGVEAGGRGTALGEHAARFCGRPPRRAARHLSATSSRTTTARSRRRTPSPPASTTPPSAPSTPCCTTPVAPSYTSATDDEALEATVILSRTEGIIPALESAHAIAEAIKLAPKMGKDRHPHGQPLRPRRQRHGHPRPRTDMREL